MCHDKCLQLNITTLKIFQYKKYSRHTESRSFNIVYLHLSASFQTPPPLIPRKKGKVVEGKLFIFPSRGVFLSSDRRLPETTGQSPGISFAFLQIPSPSSNAEGIPFISISLREKDFPLVRTLLRPSRTTYRLARFSLSFPSSCRTDTSHARITMKIILPGKYFRLREQPGFYAPPEASAYR